MQSLYRVEKDGQTFHVQPEAIGYYAENGYTIYKVVEEVVNDVEKEIDNNVPNTDITSVDLIKEP